MGEFKFSCPACHQDVLCDTTQLGTQIACPVCNATITVPNEIAGTSAASVLLDTSRTSPANPATGVQRTSGLAIASLVCSLSSLITCVGWLPGIICGHMAKSRIRRDPSLKGAGLATAGLVIGYLILISEVGSTAIYVWQISNAVKQGFQNARQNLATNNFVVVQTQPTTVSNANPQAEPVQPEAIATNEQPIESVKPVTATAAPQSSPGPSGWTSDISKATFPAHPASGELHGLDFFVTSTFFRNGDLRIRSGDGLQLDVYRLGAAIEGRSYEIQPVDDDPANPRVKITWNEAGAVETATFNKGYGMKLQFGQAINQTVSGKIYLCFPDSSKSCVAGTFKVKLPKPKSRQTP